MSPELIILFAASIACDVSGQTLFKLGAMAMAKGAPRSLPPILWVVGGLVISDLLT